VARNLYHYTDSTAAAEIIRDGVIRASTMRVYRDLIPDVSRSIEIGPVVWLTINYILEGTTLFKLKRQNIEPVGGLVRFVTGYICDVGLADYCDRHKLDPEWFTPMVQTGKLAGSDYTTWRLLDRDIPKDEWLRAEKLKGISDKGKSIWEPIHVE